MQKKITIRLEQSVCLDKPWLDKDHKIIKTVRERPLAKFHGCISLALKTLMLTMQVANRFHPLIRLPLASIERRVYINKVERLSWETRQDVEIVT